MKWELVRPAIDLSVRMLCQKKYTNHPNGCPNYKNKKGCPPYSPTIHDLIDLTEKVYVIWNEFDFGAHCRQIKAKHSDWTNLQIKCCLFWQPRARKQLGLIIKRFKIRYPRKLIIMNPEGAGVNVTETMRKIGVHLEWPPATKTFQIVLAGTRK